MNNYNFNEEQRNIYQSQNVQTEQPKVRKKHSVGKVIALIAAVAVIGTGTGFGATYLSSQVMRELVVTNPGNINTDQASGDRADNDNSSTSAPVTESRPTLDEMQQGATVTHISTSETEFNSDGSFANTRDLVSAVRDSIVYIEVYTRQYAGGEEVYGAGSGIIISEDGYIITNAHVVDDMDKYVIHVNTTDPINGTGVVDEYDAELIGSDTDTDLAVLKIKASGLQAAVIGNSDDLMLGDDVVVIGNPMGLETSVTKGIVSGLNRQVSDSERSLSSIQTDAPINSGNSGGALFNMHGEVVGVVNEKYVSNYAENVGFAITINEAKGVINDLIAKGYVTGRPILGITCVEVSQYVAAIQNMTPGIYITEIERDLPIAKSGLVAGDTIVAIDGKDIFTVSELSEALEGKKPGDVVTVTVVRIDSRGKNKNIDIEVELAEYRG